MDKKEKVDLKGLLEGTFHEYPPYGFAPPGLPKIRTDARHVYYRSNQELGMEWTTWVLFDDPFSVESLRIYQLKFEEMHRIVEENAKEDDNNAFLTFDRIRPSLCGKDAYTSLKRYIENPNK